MLLSRFDLPFDMLLGFEILGLMGGSWQLEEMDCFVSFNTFEGLNSFLEPTCLAKSFNENSSIFLGKSVPIFFSENRRVLILLCSPDFR